MFGFNKKRQAKSVEEFLRSQDAAATPSVNGSAADAETGAPKTNMWFVAPAVVAGALLVLLFTAFVKINGLKSDIAQLRLQTNKESVESLKAQVAALSSDVDKSGKEAARLKADVARLEKDLAAMKLMNTRREQAEAAAKKPAVNKKKPARPARRSA
jgi:outer membrane murein-binding lipoprotein Lpp